MPAFLELHAALILRLARRFVRDSGDRVEPSDVAQEVIAALLHQERAGVFDPARIENAEAYLRVAVRHAAIRALARRGLDERVADDADLSSVSEESARFVPESVRTPDDVARRAVDGRRMLEALKSSSGRATRSRFRCSSKKAGSSSLSSLARRQAGSPRARTPDSLGATPGLYPARAAHRETTKAKEE